MTAEDPSGLAVWGIGQDKSHSSVRLLLPHGTKESPRHGHGTLA
jgi:hypothetical protein